MFPARSRVSPAPITQASAESTGAAGEHSSSSESVPAARFHYFSALGDGDCLFRAVYLGLTDAQRPDRDTHPEVLADMRRGLTEYLDNHRDQLLNSDFFYEDRSLEGLRRLVSNPRQWDNQNGDLVPIFLAHVLGRDVKIFRRLPADPHNYRRVQVCPGNNPILPGGIENSHAAPICLLYSGLNHYAYLRPIEGRVVPLAADIGGAQSDSLGCAGVEVSPGRDEILASEVLLSLLQNTEAMDDIENPAPASRPSKKPRMSTQADTMVKVEVGGSGKQPRRSHPPLVPFTVSVQAASIQQQAIQPEGQGASGLAKRFHISPHMDLERTRTTAGRTLVPVNLISDADIATMSQRPIIQHPQDPNRAHPSLQQPAQANKNSRLNEMLNRSPKLLAAGVSLDLLKQVRVKLDNFLKVPQKRQDYEQTHFSLAKIAPENLPKESRVGHPTLGMRGVLAQQALPMGSPLQYSGQYLDKTQWQESLNELSQILHSESGLSVAAARAEADRALAAYTWEGATYRSKKYDISAFGAGNVAAMINHDAENANMGAAYFSTQDKQGQPAAKVMVYFALRDIAAGEQLLVDYGDTYAFDLPAEGEVRLSSDKPGHISGNLVGLVKAEPALTTHIETGWAPAEPAVVDLPEELLEDVAEGSGSEYLSSEDGDAIASIAEVSVDLLPDHWREPPPGYQEKSAPQQLLVRCDYREKIRHFYEDNKPADTVLPDRLSEHTFPQWCQPQQTVEKWQQPPADMSQLTRGQFYNKKIAANKCIKQYNKNKNAEDQLACFKWCQSAYGRRHLRSVSELMQLPPGFEQLNDEQKRRKRYIARQHINKRNALLKQQGQVQIAYPKWMRSKYTLIGDMSRAAFIEKWAQPPAAYEQLNDSQKNSKRVRAREEIKKYNALFPGQEPVQHPPWCRKTLVAQPRPALDRLNTLPCPQQWRHPPSHYGELSRSQAVHLRENMRLTVDTENKKRLQQGLKAYAYADWFTLRPSKHSQLLNKYRQPPAGYSSMSTVEKNTARGMVQTIFNAVNKRRMIKGEGPLEQPDWCKPVRELTMAKSLVELLVCPAGYTMMTAQEQAVLREMRCAAIDQYNAQRADEGLPPVDYADWMKAD